MSEQRVTDAQAKVFAGYDADGDAWYTADPALRAKRDELTGERMAEFEWLRDLALDLLDARASVVALAAALQGLSAGMNDAVDSCPRVLASEVRAARAALAGVAKEGG